MSVDIEERYTALVSKAGFHVEGVGQIGTGDAGGAGLICTLKEASFFVRKLVKSQGDAFRLTATDELGYAGLESCTAGKLLLRLVRLHMPDEHRFNAVYRLEPYLEMAMGKVKEFGLYQLCTSWRDRSPLSEVEILMKHLNECVNQIRQSVKTKAFQARLNSYQRSSNKNYKELTGYVDALFERYSRLLVVRVDLSYSKENSKTTQAEAKQDRERLFGNARSNKLFKNMVGYIWKLEHGPVKGFHYHMMFFFDGSKVREDVTLARRVGEYWSDLVTKGRGLYFNCNANKHAYKTCGVGMIDHTQSALREALRGAVVYLTKTDLYMKLQTQGRGMGKGLSPAPKGARGRPRAVSSGLGASPQRPLRGAESSLVDK